MNGVRGSRTTLISVLVVLLACQADRRRNGEPRATEILRARAQGLAFLQEDRLDEARVEFSRLTELAPGESAGPANLALVALRGGELDEAARQIREAVSRTPDDPTVRLVLAKILEARGEAEEARSERARVLELDPDNLRALWALSGGSSDAQGFVDVPGRLPRLTTVIERVPTNLPARLELVEGYLARGEPDSAAVQLEEVRALVPEFPGGGEEDFDLALVAARAMDAAGATGPARRLHDVLRTTPMYQAALAELQGPLGEATGFPVLAFSHELSLNILDDAAVLAAMRFWDATEFSGLAAVGEADSGADAAEPVVAVGDTDGDGDDDVYAWMPSSGGGRGYLLRNDRGRFVDVTPEIVMHAGDVRDAVFADYDADGLSDLYLVRVGRNRLFRNLGDGQLEDVSDVAGVADDGEGVAGILADVDHDGDLDLFVANDDGSRLFRYTGAGRFTEVPGAMGLPDDGTVVDVSFGDFDDDGDLDLVVARGSQGAQIMANQRQDRFGVVAGGTTGPAETLAVGDYDNDGLPDVAVMAAGTAPRLYRGQRDGRLVVDGRSGAVLPGGSSGDIELLDFDNDGHLDLLVSGSEGLVLLHNDGRGVFEDFGELLPPGPTGAFSLTVLDYNEDGDLDVLGGSSMGLQLLRNDGGNLNHHVSLRLVARGPGSGKVNRFAVGSRVEIRAGDLYQARTVRGPVTHFGLGSRLKADVIRIVWTNGVPQYLYFPGTDQDLLEQQELKGSCAFIYAWDGQGYEFVTDAMWRSALGMPLGIMGGNVKSSERIYAPPASSREYIRIPGERLRADDGAYRLQITEELWEVAYIDEVKLLAIDHPRSVELFVDEKFVPPGPPHLELYRVAKRLLPTLAVDGDGRDVLATLSAKDTRYVSSLRARRYQGIVAPHAIVLEVPDAAVASDHPFLFIQGWIFPSDASINVAVSQSEHDVVMAPRLEVPDSSGGWQTVIQDIGFPAGKDKTVIVDLAGIVRRDDPRIRIRTNVQVYWDHAFFAAGDETKGPVVAADAENALVGLGGPGAIADHEDLRVQLLRPEAADLHYRGFSREYRKGGRYGPHWFEYDDVSPDDPWLPIRGRYTRFGEVVPLLGAADDMYVVMGPGDEMTVEFDAGIAPPPAGWTRTFFLYTDGWIKDADLNTATGNTVTPLPFQAQSRYPYGPEEAYPLDDEHRAYLRHYQRREVSGSTLRLAPWIRH